MKRWIVIIILLVVILGGFFLGRTYLQSRQETGIASLQTVEATTGPLTATVGATGTVRANQFAILTFQTTGTVEVVNVFQGDLVNVDEMIAVLEQSSLSSQVIMAEAELVSAQKALDDILNSGQERAAAQLALAQAQDALDNAEYIRMVRQEGNRASSDTLEATRANLILAQHEVDLAQEAFNQLSGRPKDDPARALALSTLSAARQKRDSIQRNLNWYKGYPTELQQALLDADVAIAEAQLEDAQREWERLKDGPDPDDIQVAQARVAAAQATLGQAMIKAPFAGSVTFVEVKPGDQVSSGTVAVGIADLSRMLVDVEVSEIDINRIQVGQQVSLNFDAVLDRTYRGEVIEIGLTGTIVQGVVNFKVTVELIDPDEGIKPGMTAAVNIVVMQLENVLLVPNRAVRVEDGERVVYIMQDGMPIKMPIELGVSSDTYSEVVGGGLEEGDAIILNPPTTFFEPGGQPGFMGGMR
jgi:HlyD family secretion protein